MNFDNNWTPLMGGNVNSVAFRDNLVRRKLTEVSPAVHQLLQHLEAKNLHCIPRFLDRDDNYEYLSYFRGKSIFRPWCDVIKTDEFIAELAEWLKSYHDAVADFRLQNNVRFNWGLASPNHHTIVCHGDLGPWNCIQHNGKFQAIIDWDLARYGYLIDNIAEFAFEFIPFHPQLDKTMGKVSDKYLWRRLEVFCEAYGTDKAK